MIPTRACDPLVFQLLIQTTTSSRQKSGTSLPKSKSRPWALSYSFIYLKMLSADWKQIFDGKKGQVTYFISLPGFVEWLPLSALLLAASNHWTPIMESFGTPCLLIQNTDKSLACKWATWLTGCGASQIMCKICKAGGIRDSECWLQETWLSQIKILNQLLPCRYFAVVLGKRIQFWL